MTLRRYYNFEQSSGDLHDLVDGEGNSTNVSVTSRTGAGVLGGNSYDFTNSSADEVVTPAINISGTVTVSAWVYIRSMPDDISSDIAVVDNGLSSNSSGFSLKLTSSSDAVFFGIGDGSTIYSTTSSAADADWEDQWVYFTGVYDGSNLVVYRNASEFVKTSPGSGLHSSGSSSVHIGNIASSGSSFEGRIDGVRVYNQALTQSEIQYLYDVVAQEGNFKSFYQSI